MNTKSKVPSPMPAASRATFVKPSPANLTKSAVDDFAAKVAEKLGYAPGADLEPIVARLGGAIRCDDWNDAGSDGSLEVYPGQKPAFLIRMASFTGNLRNRFTIAHELGHYFLHSGGGKMPIRVERSGSGRIEWEANWFAAAFLLPAKRFKADWASYGHSIARIVNAYQVSEAVVNIRLENLGMR